MNTISGTAFYYGTAAERALFTPVLPHVYYFETDRDVFWFWDGAWHSVLLDWTKMTAASVTLAAGASANVVADLRTAFDGLFYAIAEAAATPGINLIVDFTGVTNFNWVQIIAGYAGSGTHSLGIQLYHWGTASWHTFNGIQTGTHDITTANGNILENYSFFVPVNTPSNPYIGTGGSAGQVRVRFYHTMAGNASHDLYIDVVALYTTR